MKQNRNPNGTLQATHGMAATPVYLVWQDMRKRCYDQKNKSYHNYGARGITVCERWQSFENFFADMGDKPEGLTIDRIDNDGNYEPWNCRWATLLEQARNKRHTVTGKGVHILSFNGKSMHLAAWAREIGIKPNTLTHRLLSGWSLDRALKGTRP